MGNSRTQLENVGVILPLVAEFCNIYPSQVVNNAEDQNE